MRIGAGLKGFSGKIMRNARACKHISVLSESRRKRQLKTNVRASERRAELFRAMPSAAENVKKRCMYMNQFGSSLI